MDAYGDCLFGKGHAYTVRRLWGECQGGGLQWRLRFIYRQGW